MNFPTAEEMRLAVSKEHTKKAEPLYPDERQHPVFQDAVLCETPRSKAPIDLRPCRAFCGPSRNQAFRNELQMISSQAKNVRH
jgi:hypothetical protein